MKIKHILTCQEPIPIFIYASQQYKRPMASCNNVLRLTLHITATVFGIAFLISTAAGQRRLDGRVITTDSIPVHNAIVHLRLQEDTTKYFRTLTDSEGRFTFLLTNVESMGTVKDFALHPNFPNPFSSSTTISFSISHGEPVTLRIHDLLGRQVRTLVSQQLEAGSYRVDWDGRDEATKQLSQGAYVSVLQTKNGIATGRLMLSGERQSGKPKTGLTRIGDVVRLGKSASLQQVSIDVRDTTAALPRFLSRTDLSYSFESDTSVTIIVDYGGWEDLGSPTKDVHTLFLDEPYLYACAGKYGLWRRNIESLTPWEFLGLSDTALDRGGVMDVDAYGADILVAYSGRHLDYNIDSTVAAWRSKDNGRTWFRSDGGIPNTFDPTHKQSMLTKLRRSPHTKDTIVALYLSAARYRSTNRGESWILLHGNTAIIAPWAFLKWNPYRRGEIWIWGATGVDFTPFIAVLEEFGNRGRSINGLGRGGAPLIFDPQNPDRLFYAWYTLNETKDGGVSWTGYYPPIVGGQQLNLTEGTENPLSRNMALFAVSKSDPPHLAFILLRDMDANNYRFLTRVPSVGNNLVVDRRNYLYWNWAGQIQRLSIKEY